MTNKQNKSKPSQSGKKVKALETRLNQLVIQNKKQKQRQPKVKNTPFAQTGSIIGRSIGGMFGNGGVGAGVGKWLGSGIGSIFGSGDYQQAGMTPKYNVMTNGSQIPQFDTTRQTNIVCHREYLGDIQGTTGFNNVSYPLNPGMSQTFPWLSTVAQNYQEYRIHGIVFEFRSLITDFVTSGAPGVVIMATNYNSDAPVYATKQQMENSEFAVSTKPTINLMHGVECALGQTILPEKFVRTGAVPAGQDLRLYDLGIFQFATQQNPVQDLGELWVSYCVEFYKPILPLDIGGDILSAHTARITPSGASPLGLIQFSNSGSLALTNGSNFISFLGQPGQSYLVSIIWNGTAAVVSAPTFTYTGLNPLAIFALDTQYLLSSPQGGVTANSLCVTQSLKCSLLNTGTVSILLANNGTYPTLGNVDIVVTEIDNGVLA